jgi:hypothetical protein
MTGISVVAQILLIFIEKDHQVRLFGAFGKEKESLSGMDFVTGLLSGTTVLSKAQSWVSITIIFLFTLLIFRSIQKTRRDAKVAIAD